MLRMPKIEYRSRSGRPTIRFQAWGQKGERRTFDCEADCQKWWLARYEDYLATLPHPAREPRPLTDIIIMPTSIAFTVGALLVWYDLTQVPKKPKSAKKNHSKIKVLVRYCTFLEKPPPEVTADDIAEYLDARADEVRSSVVSWERGFWIRIFKAAKKHKTYGFTRSTPNPAEAVDPVPFSMRKTKRFRSDADREKLFAELKATSDIHDIAMCGFLTGLRRAEIVRVRVSNIDWDNMVVTLPVQKNGEEDGERALTPEARVYFREQVTEKHLGSDDLLFPWSLSIDRISQDFTLAAGRVGLQGITFRSLRKEFATRILKRVRSAEIARLYTGHLDLETFDKNYNGLTARDAAALLPA
jgi:integrase